MARLGLSDAWESVWANDIDPDKTRLYEHNFGKGHVDHRDIALVAQDVKAANLPETNSNPVFPLSADMAWASFPCQDLSLAGRRHGMSGRRSGTYWHFHQIMAELRLRRCRPPIIAIENVTGLLYGDSFRGLCESLSTLGMRFGALVIDAKHFVPQSRPRVFVVAIDASIDTGKLESPGPTPWHTNALVAAHDRLPPELKDRWIWWNLPPASEREVDVSTVFEPSPSDVTYHDQGETKRLLALMTDVHLAKVKRAIQARGIHVGFLYKRTRGGIQRAEVRFDGVAGCLRTPKGGSSRQTVIVVENGRVRSRLLSRNEAARLMGIPLDATGCIRPNVPSFFPEDIGYNVAYRAMGDGVAVPVVRHLGRHLLTPLAKIARATVVRADSLVIPRTTENPTACV